MSQKLLNKILCTFIVIIVAMICLFFLLFSKPINVKTITYKQKRNIENVTFGPITSKNLYLSPFQLEIHVPFMKEQLEVYAIEPRFDFPTKKIKFEVKFKDSNKIKKNFEGDKLYLIAKQGSKFDFSDEKTSFSMHLKMLDLKNVRVILGADLKDFNIKEAKQNIIDSFIVPISDFSLRSDLEDKYEFKILSCCKWWGIDHFLNIYKREDIRAQKERLEIDGDILYVEEKDLLIFKDGKWLFPSPDDNTLDYPLARIKSINPNSIEIEAWDLLGNNKYLFSVSSNVKQTLTKIDQLISSVRKRTRAHISCMMDKQRMILKEKDMLIKKEGRWKLLKRDIDFSDIRYEELFYFEKIEERNSRRFLIGYVFNPMRTSFQKIEAPVISFSNQRRVKKR